MRQERTVQASIFDLFAGHEIGRELKARWVGWMSILELLSLMAEDLRRDGIKETGRHGLPAESVRLDSTVTAALMHEPSDSSSCGTRCG